MPEPALSGSEFKKQLFAPGRNRQRWDCSSIRTVPRLRSTSTPPGRDPAAGRYANMGRWTTKSFRRCSPALANGGAEVDCARRRIRRPPRHSAGSTWGPMVCLVPYINTCRGARQAISCTVSNGGARGRFIFRSAA